LNKKSLIRPLGTLEMAVMKVLWKKGEVTGKEAWKDINSTRKAALTTVLTVMERLSRKGFIK
jgi:predicted transcriptional regulator